MELPPEWAAHIPLWGSRSSPESELELGRGKTLVVQSARHRWSEAGTQDKEHRVSQSATQMRAPQMRGLSGDFSSTGEEVMMVRRNFYFTKVEIFTIAKCPIAGLLIG